MALSVSENSATITATEYFLASNSTTKTDQTTHCIASLWLDLANLAAGDSYELRQYEKVTSGGTQRSRVLAVLVYGPTLFTSEAIQLKNGWEFSLKKLAGTDRAIGWSIRQVT